MLLTADKAVLDILAVGRVDRVDFGDGDIRIAATEVQGGAELALHPS